MSSMICGTKPFILKNHEKPIYWWLLGHGIGMNWKKCFNSMVHTCILMIHDGACDPKKCMIWIISFEMKCLLFCMEGQGSISWQSNVLLCLFV
jgi:hypothetical protein